MPQFIARWEHEVGAAVAERLWALTRENLRSGAWNAADLEAVVTEAERRLTPLQCEQLWDALAWDVELARLAAGATV